MLFGIRHRFAPKGLVFESPSHLLGADGVSACVLSED